MGNRNEENGKFVQELLRQNVLVSPEFLAALNNIDIGLLRAALADAGPSGILVLNKEVDELLKSNELGVNWLEFDRSKMLSEKKQKPEAYSRFLESLLLQKAMIATVHSRIQVYNLM